MGHEIWVFHRKGCSCHQFQPFGTQDKPSVRPVVSEFILKDTHKKKQIRHWIGTYYNYSLHFWVKLIPHVDSVSIADFLNPKNYCFFYLCQYRENSKALISLIAWHINIFFIILINFFISFSLSISINKDEHVEVAIK